MPKRIYAPLDRIEGIRMATLERMRGSMELRKKVQHQLLFIFVDLIIILVILLAANLLTFIKEIAVNYSDDVSILPSLPLFIIELALTLPMMINIVGRLGKIAELLTQSLRDWDEYQAISRTGTYKFSVISARPSR